MGLKKYVACHGSFLTASCLKCKKKRTAEDIRVSTGGPEHGYEIFCVACAAAASVVVFRTRGACHGDAVVAVSFGFAVLLGSFQTLNTLACGGA